MAAGTAFESTIWAQQWFQPDIQTLAMEEEALSSSDCREDAARWKQVIEEDLLDIRNLEDDWDGQDAEAPAPELVDSAIRLAQVLRDEGFPSPSRVVPAPDGSVIFEWQDGLQYLEAEIPRPYRAEWMFAVPGRPTEHWVWE